MSDVTEREKKLLDIVSLYMEECALRTIALRKIYNILMWENKSTFDEKYDERQIEAAKYLQKEFGLDINEFDADGNKVERDDEVNLTEEQEEIIKNLDSKYIQ